MIPAIVLAATSGSAENLLAATTPGGIEAQEKRGQIAQTFADTLPVDMGQHRQDFERLGFVFGAVDGLFIEAKFPAGWRKRPTEHSMWTEIIDEHKRTRGMIFYKAAFYDQRAHAHLVPRFRVLQNYGSGEGTTFIMIDDACGKVDRKSATLQKPNWRGDRRTAELADQKIDAARAELEAWLDATYPEWKSPTAHWND